ncbi:hypothetical protein KVV02_003653 [Mortierella alpina]|uniref:Rho-GAP domain-containing protein n=1 Tax=Mortierella alpina TaxID=64518 RepID=A0A9P8AAY1_MORAP|nr:hypothetical protein KVV02_003653 [Mortierella alpina]
MSHISGTPMVPAVLLRCAEYLEVKGIDEVGLYRVPGSHASVQKLKKMFDTGKDHNLLAMEGIDPNDIATLLKLYLRELPTPLLPAIFLEQFQSLISTDRQICHTLRGILIRLPRPNYVVLSYLCHHLSRIAAHSEKTKMNVSNLGVVFAPTLSIGSVLFRALLGGYYDPSDTAESRDKGLMIVWGGLSQEFEYEGQQYADGSSPTMLTPAQEIVNAVSLSAPPPITTGLSHSHSMPDGLRASTSPLVQVSSSPFLAPDSPDIAQAAIEEESQLMAAMLLREDLAAKSKRQEDDETASNASSSSIPCTDTTALSTVSSPGMNAKDLAFEASFTSPSMTFTSPTPAPAPSPPSSQPACTTSSAATSTTATATAERDIFSSSSSTSAIPILLQEPSSPPSSTVSSLQPSTCLSQPTVPDNSSSPVALSATQPAPPTIHVSLDAGSEPSHSQEESESATVISQSESESLAENTQESHHAVDFLHKSSTGAPQLPPLEGLMIAL